MLEVDGSFGLAQERRSARCVMLLADYGERAMPGARGQGFGEPGCIGGPCWSGPGRGGGRDRAALLEPAVLAALSEQSVTRLRPDQGRRGDERRGPSWSTRAASTECSVVIEEEGFVGSTWVEGEFRPQRRDYRLTADGMELLSYWSEALARRERAFHSVVAAVDRSLGPQERKKRQDRA